MIHRRKKPTFKSNKSSRKRNSKLPLLTKYEENDYEGDEQPDRTNASESFISESFNNSIGDNSSSNSAPKHLIPSPPETQIGSYINIAPFPVFKGTSDECPFSHLSRFFKVCRANNVPSVDMMMKIFPITLDDEAALWFDLNVEPYPSLSWEEIKSSFLEAYQKADYNEAFRFELMAMNQGDSESVRSYFLRLQWILKRWPHHGLTDDLIKGVFVDGLKGDFKDWITPQKPNSLDDALRLAFVWERMRSLRMEGKKMGVKCGFCDGMHEESGCEIRGKMKELWLKSEGKEMRKFSGEREIVSSEWSGNQVKDEQKRSQCQCSKHQCGKKKRLDRNQSNLSTSVRTSDNVM